MKTRDAVSDGKGGFVCLIEEDGLSVEGKGNQPRLAIQAAEAALENAQMARRAPSVSKVDEASGLLIETP